MIILKFIGYISDLFFMRNSLPMILTAAFVCCLFLFYIRYRRKEIVPSLTKRYKLLWGLLLLYLLSLLIFSLVGEFIFYPFDALLLTELCCCIVFMLILILNKIQAQLNRLLPILVTSIVAFIGTWASFSFLWIIPFSRMKYAGHAPIEYYYFNVLFLLITTIAFSIKNIYRAKKGIKTQSKLLIIFLFLFPLSSYSWRENTHKLLSCYAVINSKLIKDNLIYQFHFEKGATQPLTVEGITRTVSQWIYDGAEKEDAQKVTRSMHHFHNPVKGFNEAGLVDIIGFYHQSQILWAQDGEEQKKHNEGDMSWKTIENNYYNALIAATDEERQAYFGLMFKGLGHQMHLIQDMGNPEHTRNDNHPFKTWEKWVDEHNEDLIKPLCENPQFPAVDLQSIVFDSSTHRNLIPISRLSDADIYDPINSIPLTDFQQGLAEYSHANFVTYDTIFSPDYPFPREIGLSDYFPQVTKQYVDDEKALYTSRKVAGEGEAIDHFLRISYLQLKLDGFLDFKYYLVYQLDELCHYDYALKLIPRSVGYSSALLDYFFRGKLELSLPEDDGIYGFAPYPEEGFKKISVMIKNVTPNEDMANGKLTLIVRYRSFVGDEFAGVNPPLPGEEQKYIKVDYEPLVSLGSNGRQKITFDLSGQPLPVNASDVTLTVVFKGAVGAEVTDAVAMGFKDISEPTAIEIYNDTGMVCFNGNMVVYTDPALVNYADNGGDGVITKYSTADIIPRTIRLGDVLFQKDVLVNKSTNSYFNFINNRDTLIDPGSFHRMYVLANESDPIYFSFLIGQKRFENSQVQYTPPWSIPYNDCKYVFDDFHYRIYANLHIEPIQLVPRINKLIWNGETGQYDPYRKENDYWEEKMHYCLNLIYYSQPNNPDPCACAGCNSYKPISGWEYKAFHYPDVIIRDYFDIQ